MIDMVTVPPPLNTLFLGSMALYNCTCHSKVISSKVKDHSPWYKISHFYFVFVWKGQYARVFSHRGTDSYWIGELLWKYTQSVWEKPRNIRTLVVVSILMRGKKREKRMRWSYSERKGTIAAHYIVTTFSLFFNTKFVFWAFQFPALEKCHLG